MAWKAKTLAKTLMTVALEITLGILSAITNRFGPAKAQLVCSSVLHLRTLHRQRSKPKRGTEPRSGNDQFRTPFQTFAGSIALSGLRAFARASRTSVVSGYSGSEIQQLSTGQTAAHCGSSKCPTHSVQRSCAIT